MRVIGIKKVGGGFNVRKTGNLMRAKMAGLGPSAETYDPTNADAVRTPSNPLPKTRSLGGGMAVKQPRQKKYISLNL